MKKAKKTILVILTLLLLMVLSACSGTADASPQWLTEDRSVTEGVCRKEDGAILTFTDAQADRVRALWEEGRWANYVPNCIEEYVFVLDSIEVRYHASCGTFYRPDTGMTFTLKDAQRSEINNLLGLS